MCNSLYYSGFSNTNSDFSKYLGIGLGIYGLVNMFKGGFKDVSTSASLFMNNGNSSVGISSYGGGLGGLLGGGCYTHMMMGGYLPGASLGLGFGMTDPSFLYGGGIFGMPGGGVNFFNMSSVPGLSLSSSGTTGKTEETKAVEEKPVSSSDDNMSTKFDNWTKKLTAGKTVDDFCFIDSPEYKKAVEGGDDEKAASIYKDGALTLARDSIKVTDKNDDGKISYNEFLSKEINDYAEAYPDESIEGSLNEIAESSTIAFNNIDLDKDGKIDANEQAAMYAAMDQNLETGDINGKIKQEEYINFTTDLSDASKESSSIRKKLEGVYKLLFGKKED